MTECEYRIELKPPATYLVLQSTLERVKDLLCCTRHFSITSKPLDRSTSGFDLSFKFASHLLKRHPQIDILFHLTCHDLDKVNIKSKLTLLKQLNIDRILVVSGDGYKASHAKDGSHFQNSHELVSVILESFRWFETIAVAGYPGGNQRESVSSYGEAERLSHVIRLGVTDVYTQCIFSVDDFLVFRDCLHERYPGLNIIPSVALFNSKVDLDRIERLTRVTSGSLMDIKSQIEAKDSQEAKQFSSTFLHTLLDCIVRNSLNGKPAVSICPFGHYDLAKTLIEAKLLHEIS